jgi:hypothetical protein
MASIVVNGDTSGAVTLSAPAVAGTVTVTLPSASGTMAVSGGSPSFTTITTTSDATISGLTVGKGGGGATNNTAIGLNALPNTNTGTNNTAVGSTTMAVNTVTGAQNTTVGVISQRNLSSGASNSSLGYASLYTNTTGAQNTAIGDSSLYNNTTASNNTAVGYQAGYTNATGIRNVYIGNLTGYTATSDYNTMVGSQAGQLTTTGTLNTFIGVGSGSQITTGSKNSILGGFGGNSGGLDIRTASNYIVLADGDGTPRGIFDNSGNWIVGTTSAFTGTKVSVVQPAATTVMALQSTGSDYSGMINFYAANGTIKGSVGATPTTVAYNTSSDYRLKDNIAPMTGALDTVAKLKPVTYTWKVNGSNGQGFIAHELQEVVPDCVTGEKDAVDEDGNIKPQGIDTSFLVATLTAAIQELKAELDTVKAELAALKG